MFQPIFRILAHFLFAIGFLAGVQAFNIVFSRSGSLPRLAYLFVVSIIFIIAGVKARENAGELDVVSASPEDIASFIEIPKTYGLGANASVGVTTGLGAAAGILIVLAVALTGFVAPWAMVPSLVLFGLYGAFLALVKRWSLRQGAFAMSGGKRFGAHRTISLILVPIIVVSAAVMSAPNLDPVIIGIIALGLLWWVGAAFHHVYEVLHIAGLVLVYGEHSEKTMEWGLQQWLRHSRRDARFTSIVYDQKKKEATLTGTFDRPQDLRRDVRQLDFVDKVVLVDEAEARQSGQGGFRG